MLSTFCMTPMCTFPKFTFTDMRKEYNVDEKLNSNRIILFLRDKIFICIKKIKSAGQCSSVN